jgi:MtrB/PioB family decaheme-associated outer membrane protein
MRIVALIAALTTAWPSLAVAQQPLTPSPASPGAQPGVLSGAIAEIDFGARVNSVTGDYARFQRLSDRRDGLRVDRFRFDRATDASRVQATVENVGYRDQRYTSSVNRYGKLKASVEWNQVPLFYSADTQTVFRTESPGVLRLDDATQSTVQSGVSGRTAFVPLAQTVELRSRRDVADVRLAYSATPRLDLRVAFTSTGRNGTQPWGAAFGQSNAVELAVPVDHRTHDMNATVEWSNTRGLARIAYDGSWFSNAVETLVFDNPLRLTDAAGAPATGRVALWPDSTAHTVSATGSVTLPGRSRAFGYVSLGNWLQDQALLPYTINSALAPIPLARPSAEARAEILSVVSRVTSRPRPRIWLNGQYRLYDYNNRTPVFPVTQYVAVDSTLSTSATGGSEPFGYIRQFVDLDASYTPVRFAALRVGYGVERDERTFRYFETTTEHTARAAIDSSGFAWGTLRFQYEHAVRTGQGLDEEVLSDIGEQVSLRQFDISDRTRDRVTALVQVVPISTVGLYASTGLGLESRPGTAFGLQDNDVKSFNAGIELSPRDLAVLGVNYGIEQYSTLQRSRQASPGVQFNDPTRDWSTHMDEKVHTVTASLDLPRLTSRTSARAAYDLVSSRAEYFYAPVPNSTLVTPQQLAPVRNEIQRISGDARYTITRMVAFGVGYAYDKYAVDDFARSPGTLNSPVFPTMLSLMYQVRPYRVHSGFVRLYYRF